MPRPILEEAHEQLRNPDAVTDAAVLELDIQEMLSELLHRVRSILDADTAAVLLLEEATQHLVARAACGLEEEVVQGIRVPLGVGFAGEIARTRQPVILERIDATTVYNHILWEKGIKTMLGVPLLAANEVVGVLHVGRLQNEPFGEKDAQVLQVAAERVAGALQMRELAIERAAADFLERSLLPTRIPSCPGLEFGVRYLTADQRSAGGDWYDLFMLPSGELWIAVGDVAGHGLEAAVVMGRVRSTLRSYALLGEPVAQVLTRTDRKIQHFEIGTMVAVVCATSKPPYRTFHISSAGSLPPILAAPGQDPTLVKFAVDPPLGTDTDIERSVTDVELAEGGLLLIYTDGLVERRGEHLDVGLERLRTSVVPGNADAACSQVLRQLIGSVRPGDDVAMVAVRSAPRGPGR